MVQIMNSDRSNNISLKSPDAEIYYYYKDLFTHKDINTYINGVV